MLQKEIININKTLDFFKNGLKNYPEIFQNQTFNEIDLSWVVKEDISNLTKPTNRKNFSFKNGVLVASGEQSFIEKMINEEIVDNKWYIGTTPCFRDEEIVDNTHFNYFTKIELFSCGNNWNWVLNECGHPGLSKIFADFAFKNYLEIAPFLNLKIIPTSEAINSYDIIDEKTGIELGSYGTRIMDIIDNELELDGEFQWTYGTAIAEPRFSYVCKQYKK